MTSRVIDSGSVGREGSLVSLASSGLHRHVYLFNATVLLAHQIDAAYWEEWTLFRLPGGVQLFVLLNIPLVLVVLVGLERLASATGRRISYLLATGGLFAAVFHSLHLAAGDDAFRTPTSLALLLATALLSPMQLACLRSTSVSSRSGRRRVGSPPLRGQHRSTAALTDGRCSVERRNH